MTTLSEVEKLFVTAALPATLRGLDSQPLATGSALLYVENKAGDFSRSVPHLSPESLDRSAEYQIWIEIPVGDNTLKLRIRDVRWCHKCLVWHFDWD